MLENAFESKTNRLIARGLIVCVALAYWWYMYVLRNANETIPYVFGILNS